RALPPQVPPTIRRLLQRCLERDPHQRIADIAAARFVLEESADLAGSSNAMHTTAAATRRATGWRVVALTTITVVVGAAVGTSLHGPFVSPDSQWVGFFDGLSLRKVRITGGAPVILAQIDATGSRGATWVTDDTIVMATYSGVTGLLLVPAAGGTPTVLTRP